MTDQFVSIKNCNIRYRDTGGKRQTILFSHGIGASLEFWKPLTALLSKKYRCISWDYPGHGLSDFLDENSSNKYSADTFAMYASELLIKLKANDTLLVGNSLGALISNRIIALEKNSISGLCLLNSAGLGQKNPTAFKMMTLPILGKIIAKPNQMAIDQQINAIFHEPNLISNELKTTIERNVMRDGAQAAFLKAIKELTNFKGQKISIIKKSFNVLRNVKVPILFIHGRQDKVIPLSHSEKSYELIKNSSLLVIDNCGHTPQIEEPQQVANAIEEMLEVQLRML